MKITGKQLNIINLINISIGIIVFFFFILYQSQIYFDDICPTSIGLFFMFSPILGSIRSFTENEVHVHKLFYLIELLFGLWGIIEISILFNSCMLIFPIQLIYGYIVSLIHLFIPIKYIYQKKCVVNNIGLLDNDPVLEDGIFYL